MAEPAAADEMNKENYYIDDRTGDLILTVHGSTETIPAEMFERYVADYGAERAVDYLQTLAEEAYEHEVMTDRLTDWPHIAPYGYED